MNVENESEVAQSCPTLSDPMDCSLLGSSVHGIFQARVLQWGAIAFSSTPEQEAVKRIFEMQAPVLSPGHHIALCLSPKPSSFKPLVKVVPLTCQGKLSSEVC